MSSTALQAFRLAEKLYFVGSEKVSVHLIESDKGLILIDTGYPDMFEKIVQNIGEVGFSVSDVTAIFHSHGHIDHFGCTRKLKELSGAKTYISCEDNEIVNGTYDLSWAKELGLEREEPFDCDVLIRDGDVFDFGDVAVRCVLTPGHTDGVLSFFITVQTAEGSYTAAMHGGMGMNSMRADFLRQYGLSFDCRRKFAEGLRKVENEKVDLVLGNHPGQSGTLEKMNRLLDGEASVLDASEWKTRIQAAEKNFEAFLLKDPE